MDVVFTGRRVNEWVGTVKAAVPEKLLADQTRKPPRDGFRRGPQVGWSCDGGLAFQCRLPEIRKPCATGDRFAERRILYQVIFIIAWSPRFTVCREDKRTEKKPHGKPGFQKSSPSLFYMGLVERGSVKALDRSSLGFWPETTRSKRVQL